VSEPGPDRSVKQEELATGRARSRRYSNRRMKGHVDTRMVEAACRFKTSSSGSPALSNRRQEDFQSQFRAA